MVGVFKVGITGLAILGGGGGRPAEKGEKGLRVEEGKGGTEASEGAGRVGQNPSSFSAKEQIAFLPTQHHYFCFILVLVI